MRGLTWILAAGILAAAGHAAPLPAQQAQPDEQAAKDRLQKQADQLMAR